MEIQLTRSQRLQKCILKSSCWQSLLLEVLHAVFEPSIDSSNSQLYMCSNLTWVRHTFFELSLSSTLITHELSRVSVQENNIIEMRNYLSINLNESNRACNNLVRLFDQINLNLTEFDSFNIRLRNNVRTWLIY